MIFDTATVPHFENPELFPAFVWGHEVEPVNRLRGLAYYSYLEATGIRVQHVPVGPGSNRFQLEIKQPWTYIFFPVPTSDWTHAINGFAKSSCSFILDVHFPILNPGQITGLSPSGMLELVKSQDLMLANLAAADAVTVPNVEWAAELSEVVENVFYLPDLVMPDWAYDEDVECMDSEDGAASFTAFVAKMATIQAASQQVHMKRRRNICECGQCKTELEAGL